MLFQEAKRQYVSLNEEAKKEEEWESGNRREVKGIPRTTAGEVLGAQLCSRLRVTKTDWSRKSRF